MLTGPIDATQRLFARDQLVIFDIDLFEINEAFASVVLAWAREFDIDMERVNPNGGAIALGHPLGATGAVLLTKAVHELQRADLPDRSDHNVLRRGAGDGNDRGAGVSSSAPLVTASVMDGVGSVRLCDPDHRNALSAALSDALAAAVHAVLAEHAGAIVLTAEPPVFCAGGSRRAAGSGSASRAAVPGVQSLGHCTGPNDRRSGGPGHWGRGKPSTGL